MYKVNNFRKTSIEKNTSKEGEPIEQKITRLLSNKEDVNDGAHEVIYTKKSDGVQPAYNVRHDKWETGADVTNTMYTGMALKEKKKTEVKVIEMDTKKDGGAEPTAATDTTK